MVGRGDALAALDQRPDLAAATGRAVDNVRRVRPIGSVENRTGRLAALRPRSCRHPFFPARSDQYGQRREPRDRLVDQGPPRRRRLGRVQRDADRDRRHHVLSDRQCRAGAGAGDRQGNLAPCRDRRCRAPRRLLLAGRQGSQAAHLLFEGQGNRRARREDRPDRYRLRHQRQHHARRRLWLPADDLQESPAHRRQHRRDDRRRTRRQPRLRCDHRQAGLDLPHRAPARRSRPRDLAERRLERPFGHQCLGLVHDGR
jgi:hypothetical protein